MSIIHFPSNEKEKNCVICADEYVCTSRTQQYCPPCGEKVEFLTRRCPVRMGGRMKSEEAREFIQDHPEWEPPHIKRRSYHQY